MSEREESGDPRPGNPESGDPESGDLGTGNSAAGNPRTGNPRTGNPGTGNSAAGNPGTGQPVDGDPDAGDAARAVPRGLRVATAISWRLLIVGAALYALLHIAVRLYVLTMSMAIAVLLSALLAPAVSWLRRRHVPRTLAAALVLIGGLAVVGGVLTPVISTVSRGFPGLQTQVTESVQHIRDWLQHGPLHLSRGQLDQAFQQVINAVRSSQENLTTGALNTAGAVFSFATGVLLVLFTLLFLLRDGRRIWEFLLRVLVPGRVRERVDRAGDEAFSTLVAYVRATAAVAFMDAAGIGIGTALVGVPLAPVLGALVFLGAFVPYVGAMLTGSVSVLVALVTEGTVPALIVLAVVVGVMQLEGHVLQPLILGHAVRLHPLAVVLGITAGFLASGIAGAILAVPVIAALNAAVRSLLRDDGFGEEPAAGQASSDQAPRHGS